MARTKKVVWAERDAVYGNGRALCPVCYSLPSILRQDTLPRNTYVKQMTEEIVEGRKQTVTISFYPCSNAHCPTAIRLKLVMESLTAGPFKVAQALTGTALKRFNTGLHGTDGIWRGADGPIVKPPPPEPAPKPARRARKKVAKSSPKTRKAKKK